MAICANQQRMYMGTARQYMEQQQAYQQGAERESGRGASSSCRKTEPYPIRTVPTGQTGSACCGSQRGAQSGSNQRYGTMTRQRQPQCAVDSLCEDLPLGAAYVNPQPYTGLVNPEEALLRGSAFNNLYDPWQAGKSCSC